MHVTVKVGSSVTIPLPVSWSAVSSDQSIVSVSATGGKVTVTALKFGTVWLTVTLAADLKVSLQVEAIV